MSRMGITVSNLKKMLEGRNIPGLVVQVDGSGDTPVRYRLVRSTRCGVEAAQLGAHDSSSATLRNSENVVIDDDDNS